MDWGQVFRGFVPTAMQLDQQNELKKQRELDEAYRQEQLGLAKTADSRTQTLYDRQLAKEDAVKKAYDEAMGQMTPVFEARKMWKPGVNDDEVLQKVRPFYNQKIPDGYSLVDDGTGIYSTVDQKTGQITGPGRSARMILDDAFNKNAAVTQQALQSAMFDAVSKAVSHDPSLMGQLNQMLQQQITNGFKVRELGQGDTKLSQGQQELELKAPVFQSQANAYNASAGLHRAQTDPSWWDRRDGVVGGRPGSGTAQNWQAFGTDKDGTPVLLNSKNFDPEKPGQGLIRIDGKPPVDIAHVYKGRTGEKTAGQQSGLVPVQGNPGLFSNPASGEMFNFDGSKFSPVLTPGGIDKVKAILEQQKAQQSKSVDYTGYLDSGDAALIPEAVLKQYAMGQGLPMWKRSMRVDAARRALGLDTNTKPTFTPDF